MRGGIDAAGEPGGDAEAGFAELARDPFGKLHAGRGGIARADDRDHRQRERGRLPRTASSGGASSIICSRSG